MQKTSSAPCVVGKIMLIIITAVPGKYASSSPLMVHLQYRLIMRVVGITGAQFVPFDCFNVEKIHK